MSPFLNIGNSSISSYQKEKYSVMNSSIFKEWVQEEYGNNKDLPGQEVKFFIIIPHHPVLA